MALEVGARRKLEVLQHPGFILRVLEVGEMRRGTSTVENFLVPSSTIGFEDFVLRQIWYEGVLATWFYNLLGRLT